MIDIENPRWWHDPHRFRQRMGWCIRTLIGCPRCGVRAKEPCVEANGETRPGQANHIERTRAFTVRTS